MQYPGYGAEEFLIITWRPPGELLADASLNTLRQMRDELAGVEGVSSVTTILDVPLLQSPPISLSDVGADAGLPTLSDPAIDRELVRREFRDSPIYAQLLVSPDGRTAAVQVNLARDDRYAALLNRREHLRALALRGELAAADRPALREGAALALVSSVVVLHVPAHVTILVMVHQPHHLIHRGLSMGNLRQAFVDQPIQTILLVAINVTAECPLAHAQ